MYPNERTIITDIIARGMAGQQSDMQGLSLQGMLEDIFIKEIRGGIARSQAIKT